MIDLTLQKIDLLRNAQLQIVDLLLQRPNFLVGVAQF